MNDAATAEKEVSTTLSKQEMDQLIDRLTSDPEIAQRITREPGFADELLKDPTKFDPKSKSASGQTPTDQKSPESPAQPADQGAKPSGGGEKKPEEEKKPKEEPKKVTLEVDESDLGTYLANGRSPAEAWAELVKGLKEKDRTIEFYKSERLPQTEAQIEQLRSELNDKLTKAEDEKKGLLEKLEAAQKASAQQQPTAPKPEQPSQQAAAAVADAKAKLDDIKIPDVSEAFDFLDEDSRKKISNVFSAIQKVVEAKTSAYDQLVASQKGLIEGLESRVKQIEPAVTKATERAQAQERTDAKSQHDAAIKKELEEIDSVMKAHKEVFGENPRPYVDIEKEFVEFMKNLVVVAGVKEGLYQPGTTNYTKGAIDAYNSYFNEADPTGKDLRDKMGQRAVNPPEDLGSLQIIHEARNKRSRVREHDADGGVKIIPYEKALMYVLADDKDFINKKILDARKETVEARARAVENRKRGVASETPASSAGEKLQNPGDITPQEFDALIGRVEQARKTGREIAPQDVALMRSINNSFPDIGLEAMFPIVFQSQTG